MISKWAFLFLLLVPCLVKAQTVDIQRLKGLNPTSLCESLILDADGHNALVLQKEGKDLAAAKDELVQLSSRLSAAIQDDWEEDQTPERLRKNKDPRWFIDFRYFVGRIIDLGSVLGASDNPGWLFGGNNPVDEEIDRQLAVNTSRLSLVSRLLDVLRKVENLEASARSREALSGSFWDGLIHAWVERKANDLALEVVSLYPQGDDDRIAGPTLDGMKSSMAKCEKLEQATQQIDEFLRISSTGEIPDADARHPLIPDFLRASGRAKILEVRSMMEKEGLLPPSVGILKELVALRIADGPPLDSILSAWGQIEKKYLAAHQTRLPESAMISLVRSAVHRGSPGLPVGPEVAAALLAVLQVNPSFAELELEPLELAVMTDLVVARNSVDPEGAAKVLFGQLQEFHRLASGVRKEPEVGISTLLVLLHHMITNEKSLDKILTEFGHVSRANLSLPEEERLNDVALAFVVSGTHQVRSRDALQNVFQVRKAQIWEKGIRPVYNPEDWVALGLFGERFGFSAEVTAELVARVFELRGRQMDSSRALTVLALALHKRYGDAVPHVRSDSTELLTADEISEFLYVPYLKVVQVVHSLRSLAVPADDWSMDVFWGSEPVRE